MEAKSSQQLFMASTTPSRHHMSSALPQFSKIDPDLDMCKLQLTKVLTHFLYIRSGKQSAVVYSLNQDITPETIWLHLIPIPNLP